MTAVVVQFLDGIVGHQVAVVEEQTVQTQACGKLEVVGGVPLLLTIDTYFMETDTCSRSLLAIIAIGQANNLGCCTVDKVIHALVAIVAGTVTHILVVRHLILITDTSSNLVVASVVCNVVLDVEHGVVHGIVPCKELVAQSHVLGSCVGSVVNIDEWEL